MTERCSMCGKQFQSPEALRQHIKIMHAEASSRKGSSHKAKAYGAGIALIAVIALAVYLLYGMVSPASDTDAALAQCIAASGAKFYGAFWCPHCNDQKALFGKAAKDLPYIECSNQDNSQKEICTQAGIDAYPTWVFPDGTRANYMTKLQLSQKTNCPLV